MRRSALCAIMLPFFQCQAGGPDAHKLQKRPLIERFFVVHIPISAVGSEATKNQEASQKTAMQVPTHRMARTACIGNKPMHHNTGTIHGSIGGTAEKSGDPPMLMKAASHAAAPVRANISGCP